MDLVEKYAGLIKKYAEKDPQHALNMIKFGLTLETQNIKHFTPKDTPYSLKYLNLISLNYLKEPLSQPDNSAWVNLFAPCEILTAMDIKPLFIEAFASFMAGFKCEDFFIEAAEKEGIAETLCSYHKVFLGAGITKVLPKPKFSITTSMVCDANIGTFSYLSNEYNVPFYAIDIPRNYTKESEEYVVNQLKEMVKMIQDVMGKELNMDKLKEVLRKEQASREYMRKYISSLSTKYFPTTLTLQMYMMFTSHVFMGRDETLEFYKLLSEDIEKSPEATGKRIYWIHLIPFYHEVLKKYFNYNKDYQILGYDLNFDYLEDMDITDPYKALAKKMISNQYNGDFNNKIDQVLKMVDVLKPDGIINFCHWGCKQSCGGVMLLKKALEEKGYPMLSLDGDGVDRRSSQNGQILTRLEAFFEMVKQQEGDKK